MYQERRMLAFRVRPTAELNLSARMYQEVQYKCWYKMSWYTVLDTYSVPSGARHLVI